MRRAAKVDGNQREIVLALEGAGATVQYLSMVGEGVPDLLVGFQERNYLIEIKDESQPRNKRKLTPAQRAWHHWWRGQPVGVAENSREALEIIGLK